MFIDKPVCRGCSLRRSDMLVSGSYRAPTERTTESVLQAINILLLRSKGR
jgi:hypothetical protein